MTTPAPAPDTPFPTDESHARALDRADPLASMRDEFHIPPSPAGDGTDAVYLTGNSLGCQPRGARRYLEEELEDWARLGVDGHLSGRRPWFSYHELFASSFAGLVGAKPTEVVAMNSLTLNLHLLMVSFYRPTSERYRIVVEDDCFPSDSYAVQSQARFHAESAGFDPADAIVRLTPRPGEACLRTSDVVETIERLGDSIALVMLGGVNYLTGQWFDMDAITRAGKKAGAMVGWDLAHGAGNVPVKLHDCGGTGADFAAWCTYKYLNAGPGCVAGAFVHERHAANADLHRFAGWWGNDPATRFRMGKDFVPKPTAESWQLSNPPVLALAPLRASLDLFDRVGIDALREKSLKLTGYLRGLLVERLGDRVSVVTPETPGGPQGWGELGGHGTQLSLRIPGADAKKVHDRLHDLGAIVDFREPDVIRTAPVPMYCRYHDAWRFVGMLEKALG